MKITYTVNVNGAWWSETKRRKNYRFSKETSMSSLFLSDGYGLGDHIFM